MSAPQVLEQLVCELAPHALRVAAGLPRRTELLRADLLAGVGSNPRVRRAESELLAVHAAELAHWLARAAQLALRPTHVTLDELSSLRTALDEERAALGADGLCAAAPLRRALELCSGEPLEYWESPLRLAELAFALRGGEAERAALVAALVAARDLRAAAAVALLALERPRPAHSRQRWLERVAACLAGWGDDTRARALRECA
jgi:hypothetical protein